ncbi:unnamed protein product [Calypogeia fissa]
MGTPGPSGGGFDIQNFFKSAPPSSPSSYAAPSAPFPPGGNLPYQQAPASSHTFSNFSPTSSLHGNNFTQLPGSGFSYNSSQPPQPGMQTPGMYHPYMHYPPQDHGPRPPPYPQGPYANAPGFPPQGPPHGTFSQPQFSSSPAPSISQPQSSASAPAPPASGPQQSQSGPQPSSSPTSSGGQPVHAPEPVSSPPLDGAHLMALLTTQSTSETTSKEESVQFQMGAPSLLDLPPGIPSSDASQGAGPELSLPPPALAPALPTAPPVNLAPPASRLPGNKPPPKGRSLKGELVVYDIDVRMPFEAQPQLEVSPITLYGSDPVLVLGRQIAVNRSYICYGLRAGTIRILNINTELRVLLRGHYQRVTDMAFFAEDVHLLASASTDGRIFVRKIVEGNSEESRIIKDHILLVMQIDGEWDTVHPRVCWHSQNQDILVVGIGKYVLTVDISKVRVNAPPGGFTADDPIKFNVNSPPEGVHMVGEHTSDVTDLSVPLWIPTCFASASQDGTVRIWGDKKAPLAAFVPHQGQPVNFVSFVSAPRRPDHTVLVTAGPFNRELKLWAQSTLDGPPARSGAGNWHCIQTLELKSSTAEGKVEKAFFNQVLVVPRASLVILANAKKKAIYVVHLEFGSTAGATQMDYLAEFSVTMPILSLTATSEAVSDGEGTVQVYCVQTQAIQQYALELSQCLPPPEEVVGKSLLESQVASQVSAQTFTSVDGGYSTTVSELTSMSTSAASLVTGGPTITASGVSVSPGISVERAGSYEQTKSSETKVGVESKAAATHQSTEVDISEGIDSLSSLSRYSESPSPHAVRPVSPAQVPSFLKRQTQVESSTKVSEDGYVLVSTGSGGPLEQPETAHAPVKEQPELDSVLGDIGVLSSGSTGSHGGDNLFEKDEEVLASSSSSKAPTTTQQQSSAGPVHLLSPSELMNMVARSKASEADTIAPPPLAPVAAEPSKLESSAEEEEVPGPELDVLRKEPKVETENDVSQSDAIGGKDGGFDEKPSALLDVKDKVLVNTSLEYSNKEFSWDGSSSGTNFVEASAADDVHHVEDGEAVDDRELLPSSPADEVLDLVKEVGPKVGEAASVATAPAQSPAVTKGRKNKNKTNVGGVAIPPVTSVPPPIPTQLPFPTIPAPSEGESCSSNVPVADLGFGYQIATMQESLNQLVAMQKELHKQMTVMVAVPVAKEGKRMESALGQRMEKLLKAHLDAMWARIQEESVKRDKLERERVQQLTTMLSNSFTKDLPAALERVFKKEFASIGPVIARLVTPNIEKTTMTAITDAFQKGLVEKLIPQLEKQVATKLETTVTRQLQSQLQQSLRPALQEALRTSFETSVIPGFEGALRAMFEQVDANFQRGFAEHTANAQQHFEASHSALAATLQDTMMSASALTASLKGELTEGQRKLIALAENAGATAARVSLTAVKQSNGGLPDKVISLQHLEESLDPTIELSRLVSERKLEEAFNKALSLSDVAIVSWLCTQVDVKALFAATPLPLSQGVLLSLVQQLGCDLGKDTAHKLEWIREGALALNPKDPVLAPHMRPFLEQLYQNLHRQMQLTTNGGELANSMRLVLHVVNSLLTACK